MGRLQISFGVKRTNVYSIDPNRGKPIPHDEQSWHERQVQRRGQLRAFPYPTKSEQQNNGDG